MFKEGWSKIVEEAIERIGKILYVEAVIVFGSWSRSGGGEWSDVDILIISDEVKQISILDRFRMLVELKPAGTDIFVYAYDEVEAMLERLNPLIVSAIVEGVPIRLSERVEKLIDYARKRFKRLKRVWITDA